MKNLFTAIQRLRHNYEYLLDNGKSPKQIEVARKNYEHIQQGVNELQNTIKKQQQLIEDLELQIMFNPINDELLFVYKYAILRGLNIPHEINQLPLIRLENNKPFYFKELNFLDNLLNNNEPQTFTFWELYNAFISYDAALMLKDSYLSDIQAYNHQHPEVNTFYQQQKQIATEQLTNLLNNLHGPAKHNIYLKIY